MARSRDLFGPYEVHPDGPVLTARDTPDAPLQRTGHGDLVETPEGETWMAYLCGRPLPSAIAACWGARRRSSVWSGARTAGCAVPSRTPVAANPAPVEARNRFDGPTLPAAFQWLRTPESEHIFSLTERPGHLRLFGRETIGSHFEQALVARRQTAFCYDVRTLVDYEPEHFQQAAGIVAYYNSTKYHFLQITAGDAGEKLVQVLSVLPNGEGQSLMGPAVRLPQARSNCGRWSIMRRCASPSGRRGDEMDLAVPDFDASILSDEATLAGSAQFYRRLCRYGVSRHERFGPPRRLPIFPLCRAAWRRLIGSLE